MNKEVMTGALMGCLVAALMTGCTSSGQKAAKCDEAKANKSAYYTDGKFDAAKAKQAYFDLMTHFKVPIYEALKKDEGYFWVLDFNKGDFDAFGMGGVFWVNTKAPTGYLGHEIYLLKNQSIPEHRHLVTKDDKGNTIQPKEESWQVRYGYVYGFSEIGEPNLDKYPEAKANLSKLQIPYLKSLHVEKWVADGRTHHMPKAESWHFMMAGPEGAIVSEYATYHDGAGLRFSVPGAKP
jgi:D-lyxose ketol-isomerase